MIPIVFSKEAHSELEGGSAWYEERAGSERLLLRPYKRQAAASVSGLVPARLREPHPGNLAFAGVRSDGSPSSFSFSSWRWRSELLR